MTVDLQALHTAANTAVTQLDISALLEMPPWRLWGGRTTAELVAEYGEPGPSMPVQLCNGMGVDTAAIITRMIEDPDARVLLVTDGDGTRRLIRVELADVTVVSAMTGNEFSETEQAMTRHLLPLMRNAGLRYAQISRGGQSQEDGIAILDDSTNPQRMFMRGPWSLADELIAAGTVPQTAAQARRCSIRAKGWVLDQWAAAEYGDTGSPTIRSTPERNRRLWDPETSRTSSKASPTSTTHSTRLSQRPGTSTATAVTRGRSPRRSTSSSSPKPSCPRRTLRPWRASSSRRRTRESTTRTGRRARSRLPAAGCSSAGPVPSNPPKEEVVRRFRPADRRSPTKVGRNGCPLGAGCYCCPQAVERWHGHPASKRSCVWEHPPDDRMCSLPYPQNIPPCPERVTLPGPPDPPAGHRPLRWQVCVDCGRITTRRWTDPQTGQPLAWCAGTFPAHDKL